MAGPAAGVIGYFADKWALFLNYRLAWPAFYTLKTLLSHTFQHSESCLDSIGCGVRPSKKSCGLSELKRL